MEEINGFSPNEKEIISFLSHIFQNKKVSFGTFNTYRSALALITGDTIGNSQNIKRFLKGIFKLRPPARRYRFTWDPQVVLSILEEKYPNETLSLLELSKKTVTLLALVTGQRLQTLTRLRVENIIIMTDGIQILVPDHIKTSRANSEQPCLQLPYFTEKPSICPARTLSAYIEKTRIIRKEVQEFLFLSTKKPFNTATTSTLSRWIKTTLREAGIDTLIFTGYSARHASTSAAWRNGITLETIRRTAGWSEKSQVFAQFYNCPIKDKHEFAKTILNVKKAQTVC